MEEMELPPSLLLLDWNHRLTGNGVGQWPKSEVRWQYHRWRCEIKRDSFFRGLHFTRKEVLVGCEWWAQLGWILKGQRIVVREAFCSSLIVISGLKASCFWFSWRNMYLKYIEFSAEIVANMRLTSTMEKVGSMHLHYFKHLIRPQGGVFVPIIRPH